MPNFTTLDGGTASVSEDAVVALGDALVGELLMPESTEYDDARSIWNATIDGGGGTTRIGVRAQLSTSGRAQEPLRSGQSLPDQPEHHSNRVSAPFFLVRTATLWYPCVPANAPMRERSREEALGPHGHLSPFPFVRRPVTRQRCLIRPSPPMNGH